MTKRLIWMMTITLTIFLAACGGKSADENENNDGQQEGNNIEFTDEEKANDDQVIVKINGTEIMGKEYNSVYEQTKVRMNQYDQDISDIDLIKEQTLNILIDQELLKQDAKKSGIEVSEEEIEEQLAEITQDSEEQFDAFLEQNHLTKEEFKDQLFYALTQDRYIESVIPKVELTDQEVEDIYEELKKDLDDIPELSEVEENIRREMIMQKEMEELQSKMKELKEKAEIETLI